MSTGRLTNKQQEEVQSKEQAASVLRSPLGVKDKIAGATALNLRQERERQFGSMESLLTPGQQKTIGRLSALTSKVTGSEYVGSLVSRSAAPIKAAYGAIKEGTKDYLQSEPDLFAKEKLAGKIGMAFVQGLNTSMLRFVKSGSEMVLGREKTEAIAGNKWVSKFGQDITGRTADEKIMTFQQIGEAVHADALAHGASEEGARKVTSLAVMGAVFAENPMWPGKGVTKGTADLIAKSTDPAVIKKQLLKEFPDFKVKATDEQIDIMSNILVNIDRTQDVESILNRTGFALNGRLSSKAGKSPVVQQRIQELSRQPENLPAVPSPTATTPKTIEIPTPVDSLKGQGSGEDLMAEARKYKSAEEFIAAKEAYKMDHRPSQAVPLNKVLENVDEYLNKAKNTIGEPLTGPIFDETKIALIAAKNVGSDGLVTVYRSTPSGVINQGDWVTLSKSYADLMALGKIDGSKVVEKRVPIASLSFAGEDITELGYFPQKSESDFTKSQLSDIWNKANKPASEKTTVAPKTAEEAVAKYESEVLQNKIDAGQPIVLGADDMKYHFGKDFDVDNHRVYSNATFKLFEKYVPLSKSDTVVLTGGGPGAGKTDFLINPITSSKFKGVIYDSNFSSVDGARNQLKVIRDAGKTPRIYGIIPNLEDARKYTLLREARGDHPVTDAAFARGHANFPAVIRELLESGELKPGEVRLFDTRNIRAKEDIIDLINSKKYAEDPLALVKQLSYTEDNVRKQYQRELFDGRTGQRLRDTRGGDSNVSVSSKLGADKGKSDGQGDSLGLLQGKPTPVKEPVKKKSVLSGPKYTPEEYSLDEIAQQEAKGEYALTRSDLEEVRTNYNLEAIFADLKGLEVKDLQTKFTITDLEEVRIQRDFIDEAIKNDPAGGLVKYMSRTTGQLPEITGKPTMQSLRGGKAKTLKNSKYGQSGDDINQTIFGRALEPGEAQAALDRHLEMVARRKEFDAKLSEISHNIRLAKAKDAFVGREKAKLARELATNLASLRAIVKAAERAGFRKGLTVAAKRYNTLVRKVKDRRLELQRIKRQYNLSDTEWSKIRRQPLTSRDGKVSYRDLDYRELNDEAFSSYLKDVAERATIRHERNIEKTIVDVIIKEKDLKRVENLQVAMELPHINKMSAAELRKFAEQLNSTEVGGEYLPARMMQTIRNTDIGAAKTINEAQEKIAKVTNMPIEPVMGKKLDNWLRLPTLAARDPLHKLFVGDWVAGIVEMRSRKFHFMVELNSLKKAANLSRREANKVLRKEGKLKPTRRQLFFSKIVPEDKLVSQYLQPFRAEYKYHPNGQVKSKEIIIDPAIRKAAEEKMTKEEVAYAKFLERFFSSKWEQVAREAQIRWTLRGVKHSNYRGEAIESVYLPHATRGFLERWRDDGFFKTVRNIFDEDIQETKIDFNAYGDRGKVLGYEKWLRNNIVRNSEGKKKDTGEILYSLNTAKVAEIYFEALEKKLVLDSLIPKVKLYEYLMGKRLQTPKHIGDPEGSEQVNSALTDHINRTLNTLKGQKASGYIEQGSSAEGAINALKVWISIKFLGVNVITQMISGVGGQATNFAATGMKAWAKGQVRAKTVKGRQLAQEYAGIVGNPPWFEIAKASNDAGDILTSGIFYGFGSLQYRAQRQMFLGMLTNDEWKTGIISKARQKDIRIKMGEWHPMPGDESVHGATVEMKTMSIFMSWAYPMIQTTYYKNLPRVVNMLRGAKSKEDLVQVMKTDEFQTLYRTVILGAATAAFAYYIFNPDKNDKSQGGYMRKRAAEELSTVLQAVTLWGIPIPGSILIGYLETVRDSLKILLSGERYTTAGPGHAAGDLKAPDALAKAFVPSGITTLKKMISGEPETPVKTKEQLKKEVLEKIESGEMNVAAAKDYYTKQLNNIKNAEKDKRFEMTEAEYKKDLLKRIEAKEVTVTEGKKEYEEYQKQLKEYAPEKFESKSDADFIGKIQIAAKALGTDPVTLFNAVFTGEEIRRMDNGKIILHRGKSAEPQEQREWAVSKRKEMDANADLRLDHTVPLQLGGDNSDSNLKLVPKEDWETYTPVENYLGRLLRDEKIKPKEAIKLIKQFKAGELTEEEVYKLADES